MILGFTSLFPFNSLKSRSYTVFQCLNTVISYIVSSFLIVYNRMLSELFYSLMSGNRSLSLICSVSLVTQLCPTFCDPMDCSTPDFPITNSQSLLKLMSIESVMPSNHLILCHPLLLPPSIFPSISETIVTIIFQVPTMYKAHEGSLSNMCVWIYLCIGELHNVYAHPCMHIHIFCICTKWCWNWSSNTLATWCEKLTHWKISWCWGRLRAGGEGDNRGLDGWMASPTQ